MGETVNLGLVKVELGPEWTFFQLDETDGGGGLEMGLGNEEGKCYCHMHTKYSELVRVSPVRRAR